jgi:hypothetical protein
MESAVLTADVVTVELRTEVFAVPRCGRFSIGIEQLPETAAKSCIGRFSTGVEQLAENSAAVRVGRFSTGIELAADADGAQGRQLCRRLSCETIAAACR